MLFNFSSKRHCTSGLEKRTGSDSDSAEAFLNLEKNDEENLKSLQMKAFIRVRVI